VTRIGNLESGDLTIDGEKTFSSNLEVGTANLFVDTTTGYVGIGTTEPGGPLDVDGTARASQLYHAGVDVPVRWASVNSTAFPQNDGEKYWKIARFTGSGGNYGRLQIIGTLGSDILSRTTSINAFITKRGGLNVHGNLEGYGVGGSGPKNYADIVVYEEDDGTHTAYLKTNNYYKFDILLLGGTVDGFNLITTFPCPEVSGTNVTPTGTLVTDSLIDECNVVFGSNGNVGIGTVSPVEKAHIYVDDAASGTQLFIENASTSNRTGLTLKNADGEGFNIQHVSGSSNVGILENFSTVNGGMSFYAKGDGEYGFRTTNSNTLRMVIKNNGNVGIGVTNPLNSLIVKGKTTIGTGASTTNSQYHDGMLNVIGGGTRAILRVENNNGVGDPTIILGEGGGFTENTVPTIKKIAGTNNLSIMTAGNVGIGTTNPQTKLAVNGEITNNNPGCRVGHSSTQFTFSTNVVGVIKYNYVFYDTGSDYSTSTGLFTCPLAGKYLCIHMMTIRSGNTRVNNSETKIYWNGSEVSRQFMDTTQDSSTATVIIDALVNDTLNAGVYTNSTSNQFNGTGEGGGSQFFVHFLG
jgi:hypothetical protein